MYSSDWKHCSNCPKLPLYVLYVIFLFQAIIYEGQDKNPEMCRVLLTHEIMCRSVLFTNTTTPLCIVAQLGLYPPLILSDSCIIYQYHARHTLTNTYHFTVDVVIKRVAATVTRPHQIQLSLTGRWFLSNTTVWVYVCVLATCTSLDWPTYRAAPGCSGTRQQPGGGALPALSHSCRVYWCLIFPVSLGIAFC